LPDLRVLNHIKNTTTLITGRIGGYLFKIFACIGTIYLGSPMQETLGGIQQKNGVSEQVDFTLKSVSLNHLKI